MAKVIDLQGKPVDQYRQSIWDSFPHLQEERYDTPETREAFRAIWERISGAEAEGVCHGI